MADLSITISLDLKYVRRVIVGAGSRYWARDLEFNRSHELGFTLIEHNESRDESEWTRHIVNHEQVLQALGRLAIGAPEHFGDLLARRDDMWTGDAILQFCCFGELKYG